MADEENTGDGENKGGMGKMLVFGGIGLVLVAVGIFAGPAIQNMISPPPPADDGEAAAAQASGPPIYQTLHPPMVVNFKDQEGEVHFMQVTMEVMSRDQTVINLVREHMPAIRNALIMLFGGTIYEEITTREGKEAMLAEALAEIQRVVLEQTGETGVEAAYFTALVVQ